MESVRASLATMKDIKVRNMDNERNQSISVEKIAFDESSNGDSLKGKIIDMINDYFECFKKACEQFK